MTRPGTPPGVRERLRALDWRVIEDSLSGQGFARIPALLTAQECQQLIALYPDDTRFRSRVQMERHRFGAGDYAYFSRPLPTLVRDLRTHMYRRLAPIANRWSAQLSGHERFPTTRTVDTHILRLRQKFEDDPERPAHILTAHGQGYRFVAERGGAP